MVNEIRGYDSAIHHSTDIHVVNTVDTANFYTNSNGAVSSASVQQQWGTHFCRMLGNSSPLDENLSIDCFVITFHS